MLLKPTNFIDFVFSGNLFYFWIYTFKQAILIANFLYQILIYQTLQRMFSVVQEKVKKISVDKWKGISISSFSYLEKVDQVLPNKKPSHYFLQIFLAGEDQMRQAPLGCSVGAINRMLSAANSCTIVFSSNWRWMSRLPLAC